MPRPWSEERKKRLLAMRAAGRSVGEIAKALGLSRAVVTARFKQIDVWARNKALVEKGFARRAKLRAARAREAIREMSKALSRGASRPEVMLKAFEAGATWREIGEHLGISTPSAYHAGVVARMKRGRASPQQQGSKWRGRVPGR